MELGRGGKGKKNDRVNNIKYIASVQVQDIMTGTESCQIIGDRREKGRESIREYWSDQSKIYPELGYINKPFEHCLWK
jgi:hypothetical protein